MIFQFHVKLSNQELIWIYHKEHKHSAKNKQPAALISITNRCAIEIKYKLMSKICISKGIGCKWIKAMEWIASGSVSIIKLLWNFLLIIKSMFLIVVYVNRN
eukprot:NODE_655_length_4980_cov_0.331899.p4 type:complete len:102 gc:universal NODE_655_length_4980_cov_0.331899:1765-1460(-)